MLRRREAGRVPPRFGRRRSRPWPPWRAGPGGIAARTAGYQRRADEWMLQANLAARELMQIGRQILASLIAEQVAHHEYQTVKTQVQQAQDVQAFLQTKFTSEVFYGWMQGELVRPLLPVLPLRLRHRAQGRADDEAGADAAGARRHDLHPVQLLGHRPPGAAVRARRSISTSSGWRWPTTTTTSASSS